MTPSRIQSSRSSNTPPFSVIATQKRNKFLSLFPLSSSSSSSSRIPPKDENSSKWKPTTTNSSSSSTITALSSTSSTICSLSPTATVLKKPYFKIVDPLCIPDYATLGKYFSKFSSKPKNRTEILKLQLLPWFRKYVIHLRIKEEKEEKKELLWGLKNNQKEKKELQFGRSTLLRWWRSILNSMILVDHDNGCIYYECILEIISRCEFIDFGNGNNKCHVSKKYLEINDINATIDHIGPLDYHRWIKYNHSTLLVNEYRQLLIKTLKYAVDKLNQKAIYSNMISFCAKILALCYFKIPGLAFSLLQVLTLRPTTMKKLRTEMMMTGGRGENSSSPDQNLKLAFPAYLHPLMTSDISCYQHHLTTMKKTPQLPVQLSGDWVRRWQSDDSELFFSFYRHYHSTLTSYISIVYTTIHRYQLYQRNAILMVSPGYMYLASFFAGKIDSLIHRELLSVTTTVADQPANKKRVSFLSPPMAPVDDNIYMIDETRPFSNNTTAKAHHNTPTGKPKPLEMAAKRYTECMAWCVVAADPSGGLYRDMINVWIRFAIKRTVVTEAESIYCLLDFIEQSILELQKFPLKRNHFPIDLPFILHTLDIILTQSDHTISLLRALSFIYVHFGFLTSHAALLDLLCNRILLDTQTFERLLLHWGKNVRIFFLRCLMWRVGRVWHPSGIRWNREAEQMLKMMAPHAIMCNGHTCWSKWIEHSKDVSSVVEMKAYKQCSLEVHIVLEALMASFHRNHTQLQHTLLVNLQAHEKLNLTVSALVSSPSPIPERIKCFSSQLTIPYATPSNLEEEDITTRSTKRSKPSTTFKRRQHILTRSRNGKSRLLKLFNSQSNLCGDGDDEAIDKDDVCLAQQHTETTNEFYTVVSIYSTTPTTEEIPHMLIYARNWKYQASNHVYASKVLTEMKAILHEYCIWLEKAHQATTPIIFVPRLSLGWPKNWTFSQS